VNVKARGHAASTKKACRWRPRRRSDKVALAVRRRDGYILRVAPTSRTEPRDPSPSADRWSLLLCAAAARAARWTRRRTADDPPAGAGREFDAAAVGAVEGA